MDRVLPEIVQYQVPMDRSLLNEIVESEAHKSVVSQLGNLYDCKPFKLSESERCIPDEELFYGNRIWGRGTNREFFAVNQTFDFGNGTDYDFGEGEYQILSEF